MSHAPTATLLVELLTEELPPKALARLAAAFAEGIVQRLVAQDLLDGVPKYDTFATPRRLAVALRHVRANAPARQVREKVLPVSVAFDAEGRATPPLAKKLAALGFADYPLAELERAPDGKDAKTARGEALFINFTAEGTSLADGLQKALDETLAKLPVPKMMTYQRPDGVSVQFVRPAHGLIALHGDAVVPVQALGLDAGRTTLGHRFMSDGPAVIEHADHYDELLAGHFVMAGYDARKEQIRLDLLTQAGDDSVVMPEALLDEVTALVEWPVVYECAFEEEFLSVPQECLILTMQTNQKYFALTDAQQRLRPRFLVVSNLLTDTPAEIIEGNERVIRPRLADAKFFYEQDRKTPLAARVPLLANVVYHNRLGSQLQRTERVRALAMALAPEVGAAPELAGRAALLAKADLLTDMVGEFPELQGTIGAYYARHDGEHDEVASACSEHYQPRFAGDALPTTPTGTAVALADKLETLSGIWGIGLAPTGEKDPFALRRHALGVLRIVLEKALPIDLRALLRTGFAQFSALPGVADSTAALYDFCLERLRGLLRERGYSSAEIEAVLSQQPGRIDDLTARLDAVRAFASLPEAEALAAANKRIVNILKKSPDGAAEVAEPLLAEPAEQALHRQMMELAPTLETHLRAQDYTAALYALAKLRAPVDTFFNDVMVNVDDPLLRANRLALLTRLSAQLNSVADISKLAS
jgi:glycyl-tRNA synthetase beta chain